MDDVAAWFLALYKTTGIKLTIFYDGYDRARFFEGFVTTLKLSAYCLVLSLLLGALAAWLVGSRVAVVRRVVTGFVALFRNTPPLVQLYFFYFALGSYLRVTNDIGLAVPELVYMSAQIWSEQVNVPEMMVVLLVCYVAMVGAINQFMQWLEARLRVPGFGQ